jgi:hypothetical protein
MVTLSWRAILSVKAFRAISKPSNKHVRCPYRVVEQATGREID